MIEHARNTAFDTISQRAAYSYWAALQPLLQSAAEASAAQAALRDFLGDLYVALYTRPGDFGLPLGEDVFIRGDEADPVKFKQVVKRKLDLPAKAIQGGLDWLMHLGAAGSVVGEDLVLEERVYQDLLRESKIKKKFLLGLGGFGVEVQLGDVVNGLPIRSTAEGQASVRIGFPGRAGLAAGLQTLGVACLACEDARLGQFYFGRADFQAPAGDSFPTAAELYAVLDPPDRERLARLDAFFLALGYRHVIQVYGVTGWEVQYQGPSRIKSSPLLRVHLDSRHLIPLRLDIKCAATSRIVDLVYRQPNFLQADFAARAYDCRGDECNWCATRVGMGPVAFEYQGGPRTICWYHNPEIPELDEAALQLVQAYAHMHQALGD